MKALGDYIMCSGVNRFVYHATTHQPYTGSQKGNIMTMGPFGTHFDRNSTWANQFSALNLYNSRCAYVLQQGIHVADILYLKDLYDVVEVTPVDLFPRTSHIETVVLLSHK